jgi:predicted DNA-binding transcriptional regulator AlpA
MTGADVDPLLGISDTERATGLERTTLWRKCRAAAFPQPIYIGNRRFWRASEVTAWVAEQAARPASARSGAANLLAAERSA